MSRDPTLRLLVLFEALALTGLSLIFFLLRRETGSVDRDADRIFEQWLYWALAGGITTIGSFAVACAVDAKIDGVEGGLRLAYDEVRQRLAAVLCWWLLSMAGVAALGLAATRAMRPLPALLVIGVVWGVGSLFVIPAIVLGGGGPLRILGETIRLLRARWGRALAGLLTIGFVFGLLFIAWGIALRATTDGQPRSTGESILIYGPVLLVLYLVYASLAATRGSFALILARDALGDLPGEQPPARPGRATTIFRRAAFGVHHH